MYKLLKLASVKQKAIGQSVFINFWFYKSKIICNDLLRDGVSAYVK